MNASRTARDRARAELTREIKDEARRQLAAEGSHQLSLRAVARKLGMVSSALYRYFPSRDDLLTALIVEAYDALGAAAEAADAKATAEGPAARWTAVCHAVRDWAVAHPHEYALIYGSPVPGYRAPADTVAPAARVPLTLARLTQQAYREGTLATPDEPLSPALREQAATVAATIDLDLPGPVLVRVLIAWTQLFGMISFELFGQLVGSADPAEEFFAHTAARMAAFVGLPDRAL